MRVLVWHVHGSYLTALVQGSHEYLVPVVPGRGPDGLGRARTWTWPASVIERTPQQLAGEAIDVAVLQRPHEFDLVRAWTGREPGRDLPAVFLEHNAPTGGPVDSRHPLADRADIPLVHVTAFNQLYWDSGRARTRVIEHGVVDPGERYTGELARAAAVVNEPGRRGRTVGADLLAAFAPLDMFGMPGPIPFAAKGVRQLGDVPQRAMHAELARRRVYVHTPRWTSLGLALVEAMLLGMPVVAVAGTAASESVPAGGGVVSADLDRLRAAAREYLADAEAARLAGKAARAFALDRFGLDRFLADWDRLLE